MTHPDDKYLVKPQTAEQETKASVASMCERLWETLSGLDPDQRLRRFRAIMLGYDQKRFWEIDSVSKSLKERS